MPQSLCSLARPGARLQPLIKSFHLYHKWPINKTAKFGMERAANARNSTALAHLHSATLHCRGRRHAHSEESIRSSLINLWNNENRRASVGQAALFFLYLPQEVTPL